MKATAFQLVAVKIGRGFAKFGTCYTRLANMHSAHWDAWTGNISLYLCLNLTPKWEKRFICFEVLVKDVLQSHKCKKDCICRTYTGCEAGSDLLVGLLLLWIKQTFPKTAALLRPSLCPCSRSLYLFCCLGPLPWAGCWSLNLSPDRSVSRGGIFDNADVIKNVLLFHFVLLLFVFLNPLAFAKPLCFIAHKISCIHQKWWAGGFWYLWLGSWGYFAHSCCSHGHCFVKHRWGSGSCLFFYLHYHSWLQWEGENQKDVDGHEDFKEVKDSCGPRYVFIAELWDSIWGCEFRLFPKLDWIECETGSSERHLWHLSVFKFPA